MGLLNQQVVIKLTNKKKGYYNGKGYDTKLSNHFITVEVNDLMPSEKIKVLFRCDFCGEIYLRSFNSYMNDNHSQWCACPKCVGKKREQIFLLEFGVKNVMELKFIKQKVENTNLTRYGYKVGLQNPDIRNKQKQTNLERYGTEYAIAAKQTRKKIKQTFKEKYNVDNPSQIDKVMQKIQQTRYENNLQASSKQQRYFCECFHGELNYPYKRRYIDIALVEDKIAIEYNDGGHNLGVKLGDMTEQEFIRNENFRKKQLFEGGWKLIEIISPTNKIIDKEIANNILLFCKTLFEQHNKHYIKIYIDEDKIMNGNDTICYKNTLNDWNEKTSFNYDDGTVCTTE